MLCAPKSTYASSTSTKVSGTRFNSASIDAAGAANDVGAFGFGKTIPPPLFSNLSISIEKSLSNGCT